jgi:hypothetical protein
MAMVYHNSHQLMKKGNKRKQKFWQTNANATQNFGDNNLGFGTYWLCRLLTCRYLAIR